MKFKLKDLWTLRSGYVPEGMEGVEIVSDKIVEHGRWHVYHDVVFKYDGKFYLHHYNAAATESQEDTDDWWATGEEWEECEEVVPVEKTVTIYEVV